MLRPAILYENEIREASINIWYDEHYKYFFGCVYYDICEIFPDTWKCHQFAVVDEDDNLVGFIGYNIDRETNSANNFHAINFSNDKQTFAIDCKRAISDIFNKFHFHKLNFSVVVGNPAEKHYDRLIKYYNGRIVGYKKDDVKLPDGKLYDLKMYEIMEENNAECAGI